MFQDHEFAKLDEYFTANLAAIFTNEEAGWNIMAYVKNVTDETAITGAFLNSDDTGLTTNVFLTEPRLYGLRVTKAWDGGPLLGSFGERREGPNSFIVEVGGQSQRLDASYATIEPGFLDEFSPALTPLGAQHGDLDRGDSHEIRLTYQPPGSRWKTSAGVRFGKTNSDTSRLHADEAGDRACVADGFYADLLCDPASPYYYAPAIYTAYDFSDQTARSSEEHQFVDFEVSRDLGLPVFGGSSSVAAGLRHAHLESTTDVWFRSVPDYDLPDGLATVPATFNLYRSDLNARREFEGVGPVAFWNGAAPVWGDERIGRLDVTWSVGGGVLFGDRKTAITGQEVHELQNAVYGYFGGAVDTDIVDVNVRRSDSATIPLVDLSLGVSYELDRMKLSTGYRWERYFDAIDGGHTEKRTFDRTIDGPYFKLAIGFGG